MHNVTRLIYSSRLAPLAQSVAPGYYLKRIGVHSSYLDEADIKDPLIIEAVLLYCHANFGSPDNQTQLLASYDAMCTKIKGGGYHREANKTID
jgi:hypothetical protein